MHNARVLGSFTVQWVLSLSFPGQQSTPLSHKFNSLDEILNSSSPSSSEPIGNNDMIAPVGKLLAPIIPPLFLGIGLNYGEHAKELGMAIPKNPILFMKPSNSIASPNSIITIDPRLQSCVDYEAELAVVIGGSGRECRNVNEKDALDHVLGYTCANDLSERRWQMEIGQWCFAKSVKRDIFLLSF